MKKLIDEFKRLYAFSELLKQLIIRDIKLKYRRSYLGYLWSILNPLLLMIVLVIVFSNLFRFDIPNFPLYLIAGHVLFIGNAPLIKKTYVPKYIFSLSRVGSSLVNLIFSLGALVLVMIITGAQFSWYLLYFPIIILQVFLFSLGIGLLLSSATVFFRDIQYLWGVFTSMWMYLTPLFYPITIIPEEYQSIYKNLNPMYGYIEQFRDIVLYARSPDLHSILIGFAISFFFVILGAIYFNKKQDEFILYI